MIEKLAEEIHNLWLNWASELIRTEHMSDERLARWNNCFVDYKELSKKMKDKDRAIAKKLIKIMEKK